MKPLKKYHAGRTPIHAHELNKMREEIKRLGNIRVVPPLSSVTTAFGTLISLQGTATTWALLKTGGASYPQPSDNCNIFPAELVVNPSYDDSDCTHTVSDSTTGSKAQFENIALTADGHWATYVPSGTLVIGMRIGGTDTSGNAHYIGECYSEPTAMFISGTLGSTLSTSDASFTTTSISNYWNGTDPTTGGTTTITINNPPSSGGQMYKGASGANYRAFRQNDTGYLLMDMECPSPS